MPHDEIKFVISDRADYEFARDFMSRHELAERVNAVLFSPAFRKDATGARDSRIACSIRRNWPSGCWPTMSRPGWACRFISSSGTRGEGRLRAEKSE